eukprot:4086371-Pleurochrysis_carterae.AAC.1
MTPAVTKAVKRTALAMRETKGHGTDGAVRTSRDAGCGFAASASSVAREASAFALEARKECEERD